MTAISNWIAGVVMGMLGALFTVFVELMDDYFGLTGDYDTTFSLFNSTFYGVDKVFDIAMALGFGILAIIYIWQLFKSLFGPIVKAERPVILTVRAIGFAAFTAISHNLAKEMVSLGAIPYKLMKDTLSWQSGLMEVFQNKILSGNLLGSISAEGAITDMIDGASGFIVGAIVPVINIILFIMLFFAFFKLLFEIIERYLVLGLLTIFAPICIATGVSEATNSICKSWFRAMISQLILMMFSIFFLSVMRSSMFAIAADSFVIFSVTSTALQLILKIMLLVTWARVGTSVDRIMKELGTGAINGGISGLALAGAGAAMRGLVNSGKSAGKTIAGGVASAKSGDGFMKGAMKASGFGSGSIGGGGNGGGNGFRPDKSVPIGAVGKNAAKSIEKAGLSNKGGMHGQYANSLAGEITNSKGETYGIGLGDKNPLIGTDGSVSFVGSDGSYLTTNSPELAGELANDSMNWTLDTEASDSEAVAAFGLNDDDVYAAPVDEDGISGTGEAIPGAEDGASAVQTDENDIPDADDGAQYLSEENAKDIETAETAENVGGADVDEMGPENNDIADADTYAAESFTDEDSAEPTSYSSNGDAVVVDGDGNVVGALNEDGTVSANGETVGTMGPDGTFTDVNGTTVDGCSVNAAATSNGAQVAYNGEGIPFAYADGNTLKDANGKTVGSIGSNGEMSYNPGGSGSGVAVDGGHLGKAATSDGISKSVSVDGKKIGTVGKDGGIYSSSGSPVGFVNESGVACTKNGKPIPNAKISSTTGSVGVGGALSTSGSSSGATSAQNGVSHFGKDGKVNNASGVTVGGTASAQNGVSYFGKNGKVNNASGITVGASTGQTPIKNANGTMSGLSVSKSSNKVCSAATGKSVGSYSMSGNVAKSSEGGPPLVKSNRKDSNGNYILTANGKPSGLSCGSSEKGTAGKIFTSSDGRPASSVTKNTYAPQIFKTSSNGRLNVGSDVYAKTKFGQYHSASQTRHLTDLNGNNLTAVYKGEEHYVTANARGQTYLVQKNNPQKKTQITKEMSKDVKFNCRFKKGKKK